MLANIPNPEQLIQRLKASPIVLAILRYGSGMPPDAADADLCIAVSHRPEGTESAHFWIGGVPVDLNIRTLAELKHCGVHPSLDRVLRKGTLLYECSPGLWAGPNAEEDAQSTLGDERRALMRDGNRHCLEKLTFYKDRDAPLCRILLCGGVHRVLHGYVVASGGSYQGKNTRCISCVGEILRYWPIWRSAPGMVRSKSLSRHRIERRSGPWPR